MATKTFNTSTSWQSWTVPAGVTFIEVVATGGQGGAPAFGSGYTSSGGSPGYGARIDGRIAVTPGETIYVGTGTSGQSSVGLTGSGLSGGYGGTGSSGVRGGYGGGATFIRRGSSSGTIIMVAAGGGGGGAPSYPGVTGGGGGGGGGGGTGGNGGNGGSSGGSRGLGATQSSVGSGGSLDGGNGTTAGRGGSGGGESTYFWGLGGGGGGGYRGGGGGGRDNGSGGAGAGGGGGSSWAISGTQDVVHYSGANSGGGNVIFTYTPNTAPTISLGSPSNGAEVTDTTPTLQVQITDEDSGQTLSTSFEIASNSGLTSNRQTGSAPNVSSPRISYTRTWTVPNELSPGTWYWRASVSDDVAGSNTTSIRSFTIPEPNTAPTVVYGGPADEAELTDTTPTFSAYITDPDSGQQLQATFQVASDISFNENMQIGHTDPVSSPRTNYLAEWTFPTPLTPGTWYWRAFANDGLISGGDANTRSFTIIEPNVAPTIETVTPNATDFTTETPTLEADITDPDSGQTLTTTFEVASTSAMNADVQSGNASSFTSPASDTSRSWTVPNPLTHGTWYWRARVSDGEDTSSWTSVQSFTVTLASPPISSFDLSPTSVTIDEEIQFTDTSSEDPTSWAWNFGDGTTSTAQNPTKSYDEPGNYTVTLQASNIAGAGDIASEEVAVGDVAPSSAFPLPAGAPYTTGEPLQFEDSSSGEPISWAWDFGDGTTSTDENPTKTYASTGTYTVTLQATNEIGPGTIASRDIDIILPPPVSDYSIQTPTPFRIDTPIQFIDESTNSPDSWAWDFGDGTTSTQQNPTKTYNTENEFTVTLTATNSAGAGSLATYDIIIRGPLVQTHQMLL